MKKRSFALILSLLLVVAAFAGCGATGAAPSASGEGDSAGGRELYAFTLMQNFTPIEQPDYSVAFFEKLEKELNLKINFQVPASSNYDESLQIMLAGGDYPEAVLMEYTNRPVYTDAVNNDLILPLNPYLEQYGQNIVKYSYDISLESLKAKGDDNIYGIPRTTIVRTDGIAVRKDWADKLGIALPEEGEMLTLDLFTELLRAFTYDDPDGNGQNDTFGLRNMAGANGTLQVNMQVGNAFGLIGLQEIDGKYVDLQYSREYDNFKRALTYMNMLWKEGYVDPDWPSITIDVANQRLFSGMYGVTGCFAGNVTSWENNIKKVDPNAELIWFTGIADDNGQVRGGSTSNGLWGFTCIMKTATKPERIVELYDYMLSDEGWTETVYGLEGVIWQNNANGEKELINQEVTGGSGWNRNLVRRCDSPEFFVGLDVLPADRPSVLKNIQASIENIHFSLDTGFIPPVSKELPYIDYVTEVQKVITKIIVGDLPVDAWDETLEGFYAVGYDKAMEQITEFVNSKRK